MFEVATDALRARCGVTDMTDNPGLANLTVAAAFVDALASNGVRHAVV